ncbi:MAG: SH3 domain-containing protein, partial [Caldilineaceae bacterium]|nr:SH3 domain-containing protein [Caldilineaceae bacterium]
MKFSLYARTGLLLLITLITLSWWAPLAAQSAGEPLLPVAAADELVAVAGGHGVILYAPDGAVVATVPAGERLVAAERSADDQWFFVRTADAQAGWAARHAVLIFERMALPVGDVDPAVLTAVAATTPTATAVMTDRATVPSPGAVTTTLTTSTTSETATTSAATTLQALVRSGTARLNVRSGPGTAYPVIDKVVAGTALLVVGRNGNQQWLQVERPAAAGAFGWVATQYVAVSDPLSDLPVVAGDGVGGVMGGAPTAEMAPA